MKKTFEISEKTWNLLVEGKSVQGGLKLVKKGRKCTITFTAHDLARYKKEYKRQPDKLIKYLNFGWLKESPARFKLNDSIPKRLGTTRVINILEQELKMAKEALIDREILDRV